MSSRVDPRPRRSCRSQRRGTRLLGRRSGAGAVTVDRVSMPSGRGSEQPAAGAARPTCDATAPVDRQHDAELPALPCRRVRPPAAKTASPETRRRRPPTVDEPHRRCRDRSTSTGHGVGTASVESSCCRREQVVRTACSGSFHRRNRSERPHSDTPPGRGRRRTIRSTPKTAHVREAHCRRRSR